ncbi:MAG TPA: DUF4350 domain-containing protein [Verrucomicrobiae bacterium]|nr:DUF4350 domain-containing protein [Verrucomicrobiae bacterium]
MSESRSGKSLALDWRGPLLAAGMFAAVFAILLLMAHQNQSNTSDMGSSLREDPYGTSLLFDSYAHAGYRVNRSQDEDSLADQDGPKTTAFFIGDFGFGFPENEGENTRAADKFLAQLEDFLSRGGRVVLIEHAGKLRSKSQDWEVENNWSHPDQPSGPTWVSPDLSVMPTGSEMMFLNADIPWLKTDSHWTALYAGTVKSDVKTNGSMRVYMAMRKVGKGELVAVSQEWFLVNETIKNHPNPVLLDFLTGGRPGIWVDEALHGLQQDKGVLWLVQRYRLQPALMLFWGALLALLWSMSGDLMRRPARDQIAQIMRYGESAGVAGRRLLQRSLAAELVVAECWNQFRRRSPQDAQAISADPRFAQRLRAALQLLPLAGYRELSQLIAERRASAKGLAHVARHSGDSSTNAEKRIPKEERFA